MWRERVFGVVVAKPGAESWVEWSMEHRSSDLPEGLAQCQQRIGELEQLVAHQAAVIAQQQEMAVVYQEQLAQVAEQLRLLKRALFGQRRERYRPSPDQNLLVHEAMIWTQQLYDLEDRAREMSVEDRQALHQAEALPTLTRMKARFEEVRPALRPTSKLAEAIDYVLNRWEAFVRYTNDGGIPIDNNVIERLLRPVAIGRKNFLFFGSEKGGQTAATLYTLVQSARRNCVNVWPCLTDVLRRLPAMDPADTEARQVFRGGHNTPMRDSGCPSGPAPNQQAPLFRGYWLITCGACAKHDCEPASRLANSLRKMWATRAC